MKTLITLLLLLIGLNSVAQGLKYESQDDALRDLFFDLDIDSEDDVLVKQIETHPTINFVTTGKTDTLTFGTKVFTMTTPKQFGMPEYRLVSQDKNCIGTDSTFLFLGGGGGVMLSEDMSVSKSYKIESVEIIRYFSDSRQANETYLEFCAKLAEMLPDAQMFDWNEADNMSRTIELGTELSSNHNLLSKHLVVQWYEMNPEEEIPVYIISLSYEKSIINEVL